MMMLTKWQPRSLRSWDPFMELAGFRRLFDEPFGNLMDGLGVQEWRPLADVVENKDGITLKVELPGVKQEDINISIENETLTVKGERKQEAQTADGEFTRTERVYGTFQRTMALPTTVDAERVKATYRDGVLEITLPRKEEAKPKAIKVEAGS
jgi:HSP20 family protein